MQNPGDSNKSIQRTGISQKFVDQASRVGIITLKDFMGADIPTLSKHPEFSMIWYTEMLKVIESPKVKLIRESIPRR